jgi:parallel beta-helix repeat protein
MKSLLKNADRVHSFPVILLLSSIIFILIISTGCKKEITPLPDEQKSERNRNSQNENEHNANIRVHPGGSIQAAVNAARPGTIITIDPGQYNEAIVVDKPGILIIGASNGVVIQNPGEKENGITVTDKGDGFVLKNVTVKNFGVNGVLLDHVNGFLLSHVTAVDNGAYGLFPEFCTNGVVDHCTASGHSDTGIYVGQSSNIVMSFNTAFANVNGLEVENSKHVIVTFNKSFNNSAGLAIILLPGLVVKSASDILVYKNNLYNNNHPNFAPPGGGFESLIPNGVGILLLGADHTTILENTITGNNFVGVATISTLVLGALAGLPPSAFADIEPNPDGTSIRKNVLNNNGSAPPAGLPFPGVDLLWDGSGTNNCWKANSFNTSYPSPLPVCL